MSIQYKVVDGPSRYRCGMANSVLHPLHHSLVERAFQLARSGEFLRIRRIADELRREGYLDVENHLLDCPLLRKQLRQEMAQSRGRWTRPLVAGARARSD